MRTIRLFLQNLTWSYTYAALNAMFLYCKSRDLEVSPDKTKVTIYCNRNLQQQPVYIYDGQELEIDDGFVYLGTQFSYHGRFQKHKIS